MTEIEQLNADIATMKEKLAKLEEEAADPWRKSKEAIPMHIVSGGHNVKAVAEYAVYLQTIVDDLEAKITKRPVVWCVLGEGGYMRRRCGCIKTFTDRDKRSSPIPEAKFKYYTGEQE